MRLGAMRQPGQQALLETRPFGLQQRLQLLCRERGDWHCPLHRTQREVGIKQIGRVGAPLSTSCRQRLIGRQQAQRLVRLTGHQIIQIFAECCQGLRQSRRNLARQLQAPLLQRCQ